MTVPQAQCRWRDIPLAAASALIGKWWGLLKNWAIPRNVGIDEVLLDDYALALLWRTLASGDPVEDLGAA
eukprot:8984703-Alexandrium_andersonii.AAC.1